MTMKSLGGLFASGLVVILAFWWALSPRVVGLLEASFSVALPAGAISLVFGAGLAVLIHKTNAPGHVLAERIVLALLFVPLYLHAAAWQAGFGMLGWFTLQSDSTVPVDPLLDGWAGAVWVHAMASTPWVALILGAALRGVDPRSEEEALLNAPACRVALQISLRCVAPAAFVAALLVLVFCMSEMTVTDIFQVRTFAEEIYTQAALGLFDASADQDVASRLDVGGLIGGSMVIAVMATTSLVASWSTFSVFGEEASAQSPWRATLKQGRFAACATLVLLVSIVAAVPIGNLLYKAGMRVTPSGDAWRRDWSSGQLISRVTAAPWEHRRELGRSFGLGIGVATAAVVVGGAIAWRGRARRKAPWGWFFLAALCLTIPGPLLGVATIRFFNQPIDSSLAPLTWCYDQTLLAPWLVQMVRATPIVALILGPVWRSVPEAVLEAARSEGAGPWRRVALIAVPMRWKGILAAWLAGFAISVGELSATILVSPPGGRTITEKLFSLLHYGVDDRVAALCLVMLALFMAIAWLAAALWRRTFSTDPTTAAPPATR